jgi:CRP-like cAMP-binding protein
MIEENDRERLYRLIVDTPQFDTLEPVEREILVDYVTYRLARPGETLTREGDTGTAMYFVVRGRVEISRDAPDGRQTVLARFNRGATVGEMSLIDEATRSANALVTDESELLELSRVKFEKLLEKFPVIGVKVLRMIAKILAHRLRYTSGRFADMFR